MLSARAISIAKKKLKIIQKRIAIARLDKEISLLIITSSFSMQLDEHFVQRMRCYRKIANFIMAASRPFFPLTFYEFYFFFIEKSGYFGSLSTSNLKSQSIRTSFEQS